MAFSLIHDFIPVYVVLFDLIVHRLPDLLFYLEMISPHYLLKFTSQITDHFGHFLLVSLNILFVVPSNGERLFHGLNKFLSATVGV